ncbi:phosphoethanolamine transferase [Rheinheimera sp.]|uniref:phosphoethanolamine transferase n=1 Tax=Rheinheimera sp. TaxID=1869214 RepID=UPI0026350965|nr:phosphoethanolamine--lipid A transferase [Rheinheimera sp.]MCA1929675.1 phosphoethanolamine--lipid A transferase [Rheinheimera sp.]
MFEAILSPSKVRLSAISSAGSRLWHPFWFALVSALGMTLLLNGPFLAAVQAKVPGQYGLQLNLMAILFLLNLLLLVLFSFRRLQKPMLLTFFAIGALSYYFIDSFGIVIDKEMLQNAIETDTAEARSVLTVGMVWQVLGLMLFPLLCIGLIKVRVLSNKQFLLHWLVALTLVVLSLFSLVASGYSDLAPFFRNHREVKHLALPFSPVSAAISFTRQEIKKQFPEDFIRLGEDAVQPLSARTAKPRLIVLVLGETARADHFQLNGYARATNPKLSQLSVTSFSNVSSCGTATAHSVPCMFSNMGRQNYDEAIAKNSSNVLDILSLAGIEVSWLDNNSGCKGVCQRVDTELLFTQQQNPLCDEGQCLDEVLLLALEQQLQKPLTTDRLIVLHQLGSHGPEYFKRSAEKDKAFLPECTDKQLQLCQTTEVVNAYDNSIVATDSLLAGVINRLNNQPQNQTALLYLSDHGESLGENGIYLHGLPYWMAPKAQTRVPMLWWMSGSYADSQQLTSSCLAARQDQSFSHDNLFHSLLGMFQVKTTVYQPAMDIFHPC